MAILRVTAPAKINLCLHVTGKRADGYHLLESLVAFADFGDVLEIKPAETLALDIRGPLAASLQPGEDNSVIKAARLLKAHTGYQAGAHITLEKHIPVGAGLGGGSSDAAAVLLALKKLWGVAIDEAALQKIALQVGSDVPVCLMQKTAWMGGIGERVAPVDMAADVWILLVNPGLPLATADVFRRFSGAFSPPEKIPEGIASLGGLLRFIAPKHNALEAPAIALTPIISDVLAAIGNTQGCKLARMSGSGATCFGLYDDITAAQQAETAIKRPNSSWWSVATKLL